MGLAIVRAILKRHGGDIEIQSQAGMGTEVSVVLPIQEELN